MLQLRLDQYRRIDWLFRVPGGLFAFSCFIWICRSSGDFRGGQIQVRLPQWSHQQIHFPLEWWGNEASVGQILRNFHRRSQALGRMHRKVSLPFDFRRVSTQIDIISTVQLLLPLLQIRTDAQEIQIRDATNRSLWWRRENRKADRGKMLGKDAQPTERSASTAKRRWARQLRLFQRHVGRWAKRVPIRKTSDRLQLQNHQRGFQFVPRRLVEDVRNLEWQSPAGIPTQIAVLG